MGSWAEEMIIREVQEKSKIKQEKIALQNKIVREKKQEVNTSAMRLFLCRHIDNEWFWKFIAYAYFVCRTLGLLILISIIIFGRSGTVRFMFIYIAVAILNLIFYKYISKKRLGAISKKTYSLTPPNGLEPKIPLLNDS